MGKRRYDGILWVTSVLFLALLVVMLFRGSILAAVLCLILALLCNPVTIRVLETRGKLQSKKVYGIVVGCLMAVMVFSAWMWPAGVDKNHVCYWTEDGKSYHFTKDCPTLGKSDKIIEGKVGEALKNGHSDPCNICAGGK